MTKKLFILSSIALLASTSVASAAHSETRYVARNVQQGPSRWGIVLVPVSQDQRASEPYALTGRTSQTHHRPTVTIPSHPRGTHPW